MNVLAVVSPNEFGVRVAKIASELSKNVVIMYSTQKESPELEEYLRGQGVNLKTYKEQGSIVSDIIRISLLENIDLICVPARFTENIRGLSAAVKSLVESSPVSVYVVK